ncbi:MAG: hypothetical protein ACK41O_26380 [Runella zeae]
MTVGTFHFFLFCHFFFTDTHKRIPSYLFVRACVCVCVCVCVRSSRHSL